MSIPKLRSTVGKQRTVKKDTGEEFTWEVIHEVQRVDSYKQAKTIVFQELKILGEDRTVFRFGYYNFNDTKGKGKWQWALNAPMIPPEDLKAIVDEAREAGWLPG